MNIVQTLLTVEEVSKVLQLPTGSVRRLVRRGLLPAIELPGGHVRVEESSLAGFIEGCKGATART